MQLKSIFNGKKTNHWNLNNNTNQAVGGFAMKNGGDKKRKIQSAEIISIAPLETLVYFEDGSVESFSKSKMERELSADQISHIMKLCKDELD